MSGFYMVLGIELRSLCLHSILISPIQSVFLFVFFCLQVDLSSLFQSCFLLSFNTLSHACMAHVYNPSAWEVKIGESVRFSSYVVSSRLLWAT